MEIREKIVIKEKESANIPTKGLKATLKWKRAVDLDLYAIYETKDGQAGVVYYGRKGSLNHSPYIALDHDAGIGDTGGDNEENMTLKDLADLKHVLIVANIFSKSNAVFASYDGEVSVVSGKEEFVVPLTSKEQGNWCIIAHLDNTALVPKLNNVNQTVRAKPSVGQFLRGELSPRPQATQFNSQPQPKPGLFKRITNAIFGD